MSNYTYLWLLLKIRLRQAVRVVRLAIRIVLLRMRIAKLSQHTSYPPQHVNCRCTVIKKDEQNG